MTRGWSIPSWPPGGLSIGVDSNFMTALSVGSTSNRVGPLGQARVALHLKDFV